MREDRSVLKKIKKVSISPLDKKGMIRYDINRAFRIEEKTMRFPSAYNKTREWIMRIAENPETEVEKLPAERQICTILDVSRDTVRRVIAALVEEGILEVRHGNGTYINAAALKRHKKQLQPAGFTVGIIFYGGNSSVSLATYVWGILQSVINELSANNIRIMLLNIKSRGVLAISEIAAQGISGLIWFCPDKEQLEIIRGLKEKEIPVVMVGGTLFHEKSLHYVGADDAEGGRMAGEYLLKNGHHDILYVARATSRNFDEARYEGYCQALARYGVSPDPALEITVLDLFEVYQAIRKQISSGKPFTAIFCADGIFLNVIQNAVRDENKKIPDDYSLITFSPGHEDFLPYAPVQILQDLEKYGVIAARGVIDLVTGRRIALLKEFMKPRLISGASCRKIPWNG